MRNTIEIVNSRGDVVLRVDDGSYVLAQQMEAQPLRKEQVLEGSLNAFGIEIARDVDTGATYEFFIAAYDLSHDAALEAMR